MSISFGAPFANSQASVEAVRAAIRWCRDKRDAGNPICHALGMKLVWMEGWYEPKVDPVMVASVPTLVLATRMVMDAEMEAGMFFGSGERMLDYDAWTYLIQRLMCYFGTEQLRADFCGI